MWEGHNRCGRVRSSLRWLWISGRFQLEIIFFSFASPCTRHSCHLQRMCARRYFRSSVGYSQKIESGNNTAIAAEKIMHQNGSMQALHEAVSRDGSVADQQCAVGRIGLENICIANITIISSYSRPFLCGQHLENRLSRWRHPRVLQYSPPCFDPAIHVYIYN